MRLSLSEVQTIVKHKDRFFPQQSKLYLFGSRFDDLQKGGDIDLYLLSDEKDLFEEKLAFLTALKEDLGEQKIDLIISKDKRRLVEQEAIQKGVELNINAIKLEKYFKECDKHLQRIEEAYGDMQSFIPLSVDKYKNLSKDEVQDIDQYLYRFSKLQDTLGDKVFKLLVQEYVDNVNSLSFKDMLYKLEKIDYLSSAKEWIYLREIRNEIAHQYDDEADEMTQAMNKIINQKEILKAIYLNIKEKYLKR